MKQYMTVLDNDIVFLLKLHKTRSPTLCSRNSELGDKNSPILTYEQTQSPIDSTWSWESG